jgi:hypothetical protein
MPYVYFALALCLPTTVVFIVSAICLRARARPRRY